MRATFQDRDTASLMGVNIQFIYMATFAIGSSLAAAAGALLGPVYVISPQMGDLASLKAFAIVILGGLGSIGGATIGGFILAFAEEDGRRIHFIGLSRCDGISDHHCGAAVQADGSVRAFGANWMRRFFPWLALLAVCLRTAVAERSHIC